MGLNAMHHGCLVHASVDKAYYREEERYTNLTSDMKDVLDDPSEPAPEIQSMASTAAN